MTRKHCLIETSFGWIAMAIENDHILMSTLPVMDSQIALEKLKAGIVDIGVEDIAAFGNLPGRLKRYFDGERISFDDVKIDISRLGSFTSKAVLAAKEIGYGTVSTYSNLAKTAGSGKAARAAGSAMAKNKFPIIVPCHRVIATNGELCGFAGGLELKKRLLALEGVF